MGYNLQQSYAFPLDGDFDDMPDDYLGFHSTYRRRANEQRRRSGASGYGNDADVGLIFAHRNGGALDQANVYMQDRGWNRRARDNYDELNCAFCGRRRCQCAFDASARSGGRPLRPGWTVDAEIEWGRDELRQQGLWTRPEGGFDPRSPAIQDGRVQIDTYGRPVGVNRVINDIQSTYGPRSHGMPTSGAWDDAREARRYAAMAANQQRQQSNGGDDCSVM